jgi:hypothetical protein
MKLRIKGTYRHRTRVKILWFWIVEPWKTDNFDQTLFINDLKWTGTVGPLGVSLAVTGKKPDLEVNAIVAFMGQNVFSRTIYLKNAAAEQLIHAEPVKGAILNATLSLED